MTQGQRLGDIVRSEVSLVTSMLDTVGGYRRSNAAIAEKHVQLAKKALDRLDMLVKESVHQAKK